MRRTTMIRLALMALAVSAAGVARPARAGGYPYILTDLGTLPGGYFSQGNGVNDAGQVAGTSYAADAPHAFLSAPGGGPLQDLGAVPGGFGSSGLAVNASGQVAGYSYIPASGGPGPGTPNYAFLSGPDGAGPLTNLGVLPGMSFSVGHGVNDAGQVAGDSLNTTSGEAHAFLSGPGGGALKDLGTLGGTQGSGNAVNDAGQVAGTASTASGATHAFLSGPGGGALQDLGTLPGGAYSNGNAVNASGQVAGSSVTASNVSHAFLSGPDGGPLQDLGPGDAFAVNDSGQVVGGSGHAFLYSGGQMFDLNSLIAPGSGFTLGVATGISDTGYITGTGTAPDGSSHAFLLTLVPEPSGWVLLGTGALGLLGYTARRRARTRD
jgi:probable HAF family extracellular repeat protein